MSMPPVDEGQTMLENDIGSRPWLDTANSPISVPRGLAPPDRPTSAPPVLEPDGSNLFAFQAAAARENQDIINVWEALERPNSAPPFDKEEEEGCGKDNPPQDKPVPASLLGAIGTSRAPNQPALGPKNEVLLPKISGKPQKISSRPLPTSPPPQSPSPALRDRSIDSGLHRSPGILENRSCSADLFGQRDPPWGARLENDIERRCTPPPASLSNHMDISPTHGLSTPPPQAGFGSPNVHTPWLLPSSGSGENHGPALLHPGTVRAFDPIDRPISAPPSLDAGAAFLALQATSTVMPPADIRCDESYNEFLQMYQGQNVNLPPPLDPQPDLLHTRTFQATDRMVPDAVTDGKNIHTGGLSMTSFHHAAGFQDAAILQAQIASHVGNMPRSPSPPWESTNAPGATSAQLAQQYAQQSLHAQYAQFRQQQIPTSLSGGGETAALRHSTLLGAAGYPGPAHSEGQTPSTAYHWQLAQASAFAAQMATASQMLQGKGGMPSPPLLGTRQPSRLQGLPLTSIRGGHDQQFDEVRSNHHALPQVDLSKRSREIGVDSALGAGRGQRITTSVTPNVLPGVNENVAVSAAAVAAAVLTGAIPEAAHNHAKMGGHVATLSKEWEQQADKIDKKSAPRPNFKMSQLEEAFATNAFLQNVYPIAKDQAGCRMLQQKLDEGNPEVTNSIFVEVLTHCVELMMDPFGNYLCQKLLELCNHRQLELILDKVCNDLVRISLNMHGARAVQKLIDAVRMTPHVRRLSLALEGAVVALTKDPNGNHVVQRCLEVLPVESRSFIFRAVAADIIDVSSHKHGCRIVQRCIDASQGDDRNMLVASICIHALALVQDAYGNYVVQYVLGLCDLQATTHIIHSLFGRLHLLARQKFSSNVIEKCLQLTGPDERHRMMIEISDSRGIGELLRDVYGNYVVQSALSLANEHQLQIMLDYIRPVLPSLRASGQGRRIAQKLEKKYPQLRAGGGDSSTTGVRNQHCETTVGGTSAFFQSTISGTMPGNGGAGLVGQQESHSRVQGLMPGLLAVEERRQFGITSSNEAGFNVGPRPPTSQVSNSSQSASGRGGGKQKKGRKKDS